LKLLAGYEPNPAFSFGGAGLTSRKVILGQLYQVFGYSFHIDPAPDGNVHSALHRAVQKLLAGGTVDDVDSGPVGAAENTAAGGGLHPVFQALILHLFLNLPQQCLAVFALVFQGKTPYGVYTDYYI